MAGSKGARQKRDERSKRVMGLEQRWSHCRAGTGEECGRSSGQPDSAGTFAAGVMTTEERGSQGDEFVKTRWATCQIIMQ
jgi:hypothetical protein